MPVELHLYAFITRVYGVERGSQLEKEIKNKLYYFVPGYERTEKYKFGGWDGKNYLFNIELDHHVLPTGLVFRLVTILGKVKINYTIIKHIGENAAMKLLTHPTSEFSLRPYQEEAVGAVYDTLDIQFRAGGVIRLPTGTGKTRCLARYIQLMNTPAIVYVHTKSLFAQMHRDLTNLLGIPIGRIGDGVIDVQEVTVAMVQTVARLSGLVTIKKIVDRPKKTRRYTGEQLDRVLTFIRNVRVVALDEAHHAPAVTFTACLELSINAVAVLGLSASPWRDDGLDILIEAACGPIVYSKTATDVLKLRDPDTHLAYLVQPIIYALHLPKLLTPHPLQNSKDHHDRYHAWITDNGLRHRYTAALADYHVALGDTVLILIQTLDHGERLLGYLDAAYLEGKDGSRHRKKVFEAIEDGTLKCLIATTLADEGIDLPIISCIILAGAGSSSTRALQRVGRGVRPYPSKKRLVVYDLVDWHKVFRDQHADRRAIWLTEPGFKLISVPVSEYQFKMLQFPLANR